MQTNKTPGTCQFLLMADAHIEYDFTNDYGSPWYTGWKPHHEALIDTYRFVNENYPELDFALFCGDTTNTGYEDHPQKMANELVNYWNTIAHLDVYKRTVGTDLSRFCLAKADHYESARYGPDVLQSAAIAAQGNHDPGVRAFYRDCSFICNKVKFVCFFARYCDMGRAPDGDLLSTGLITDDTLAFVEREFKNAADQGIEHLILVCHWGIVMDDPNFGYAIVDACSYNYYNNNRQKIMALCEEYGCELYLSGHEHNNNFPVGKAGILSDINLGTATEMWGLAEVKEDAFVLDIFTIAKANPETGEIIKRPEKIRTITLPLRKREEIVKACKEK